jgi:quinol monooxygenase YgiN
VPFFVAVRQQVPLDRLHDVVAAIQRDFASSHRHHAGRRRTRLYQHVDESSRLLAVGEWERRADYERLRDTPAYQATSARADPPAAIDYLMRLSYTGRMHLVERVAGGAMLTMPAANRDAVERIMTGEDRRVTLRHAGLVSHEVYRVIDDPRRLLVVHTWVSIDALRAFRRDGSLANEQGTRPYEVTVERFVGALAAEFSHLS